MPTQDWATGGKSARKLIVRAMLVFVQLVRVGMVIPGETLANVGWPSGGGELSIPLCLPVLTSQRTRGCRAPPCSAICCQIAAAKGLLHASSASSNSP